MLKRFIISVILVILTSFYVFPVSLSFLPASLNTKIILAAFGILAFIFEGSVNRTVTIPKPLLFSALLAFAFSVWCYYCVIANGTEDVSYARYWISFFTWTFGAYAIFFLTKHMTGSFTLGRITGYLTAVCVAQCILAEIIAHNPGVQQWVDRIFVQGQEFYQEVNRMYGIGAALDTAGVRFSVVLVLMAHQMSSAGKVMDRLSLSLLYFISFILVTVIGSMIARTTWLGAGMGLAYMIVSYMRIDGGYLSGKQLQFWMLFVGLTFLTVLISVIMYRTSPDFRSSIRFGFEGFFSWAETGSFRTGSTDKLNREMWVWPSDPRGWTIGYGLYDNWAFSTDIGYCRLTLYCGLVGMALFSLFFVYNGMALYVQFNKMAVLPLFLIAITFVIWIKVSTDIFFIYALLFFMEVPLLQENDRAEVMHAT